LHWGRKITKPVEHKLYQTKQKRKLKIGYVSTDFRRHSVAYFFEPLLIKHSKELVETYCYYSHSEEDEVTLRLKNEAQHWRSIVNMNNEDVVKLVREDNIDILVDLSGHTRNNRLPLFVQKPAPIQIAWLGYPNTTGLSTIDYRFTDSIADPVGASDDLYSEKLIRLPNGFLCYQGDESIEPTPSCLASSKQNFTFGSFNNISKLNIQVIKLWAVILNNVKDSRLVIKSNLLSDEATKNRFLLLFEQQGVSRDQIELCSFLPVKEHLELYNRVDIGLDPFPYNGTTTTCEALWMGVPTITMNGDRHVSRVGASILTRVGLSEFIAEDPASYVQLAIDLSQNITYLRGIKTGLRQRVMQSKLCDAKSFASDVEKEYLKMWGKYRTEVDNGRTVKSRQGNNRILVESRKC